MRYTIGITMIQLHKFDDDINHFHNSGYAEAAYGNSIGATSSQSYSQRAHIERNRQHVNAYSSSMIGARLGYSRPRSVSYDTPRSGRGQIAPPARSNTQAPVHRFQEPPQRYNPYA